MTANLDLIIRPFQTPILTPATVRQPNVAPPDVENVVIKAGEVGEGNSFTGSFSHSESYYMDAHSKEDKRTSKQKRIENPDNPDDFVKVANVKRLETKSGTGQDYQKTVSTYQDKKEPGETP